MSAYILYDEPKELDGKTTTNADRVERQPAERTYTGGQPVLLSSERDRIVLSHALFWVMTRSLEKVHSGNKCFLLLRQYEEEMLDAYLTDSEEFPELLRYCNILYEAFPLVLNTVVKSASNDKPVRKLMAISVVAGGVGGDMPDDLANELLDDMDFSYNKVCCRKIERMSPLLNKMVEKELEDMEEYY